MRAAGLSIEGLTLGVSVIEKRPGLRKVIKTEEIVLPAAEPEKIKAVSELLLRLKKEQGVRAAAFGLGARNFSHHFVQLPVKDRADIERALSFEMEKYLPLPPEEYVWDFHTVISSKSGSTSLVLAVKKERLSWITECMNGTGLRLMGVMCTALEVVNGFLSSGLSRRGIFVYRAGDAYFIAGIDDSLPRHVKALHDPAQAASEVESLKGEFGESVFAAGEFAGAKDFPVSPPELIAASAFKKRGLELDFTPDELKAKKADYYSAAIMAMSAVSVVLFFLTSALAYYKDYGALKDVTARIEAIGASAKGLMEAQKDIEGVEAGRRFLAEFAGRRNISIKALRQLSLTLPEGVWLTGFSADEKGKITIDGYASRAAGIVEPIEKSPLFRKVEFAAPITVEDDMERFFLTMEIEG